MRAVTFPIETERLRLRPLTFEDADDLYEVFGDAEAMRFLTRDVPASVDEVREVWLRPKIEQQNRDGISLWAVVERSSGKVIGDCGLQLYRGGPDVEVGGRGSRAFWGRGYATESALACLRVGFERLRLERVVAETSPENVAAQRVLDKLGMAREKSTQEGWPFYSLTSARWRERRTSA